MFLEIATFDLKSALIAAEAGASRIEFCDDASTGGVTPSIDDFRELKSKVKVPVFVMIRPRAGSYQYNEEEIEQMLIEIDAFNLYGADGFVFGAVNEHGHPDFNVCQQLVQAAGKRPCTFHRAFDEVPDWKFAIDVIERVGFKRILTSGKPGAAPDHAMLLAEMMAYAERRIQIMPGGGVRSNNAGLLLKTHEYPELHSSGITAKSSPLPDPEEIKALLSL